MPDMSFFSTRQDMETALDEAESAQHVMYVASRSGDGHPSVYRSHREISDWEYQFRIFYVVPVDTRFTCKRDENNDTPDEELFSTQIAEGVPEFRIAFGRRMTDDHGEQCLICGSIVMGQARTDFTTLEYELYRPFATAIHRHLTPMGWQTCWYSPRALQQGAEGCYFYNHDRTQIFKVPASGPAWNYKDLIEYETNRKLIPKSPERMSLNDTWDFLDAAGQEPQRDEDGNPALPAGNINAEFDDDDYVDDDDYGLSFLKEFVTACDFSNLTIPRMSVNRTELSYCNFHNSDLKGSRITEADILECDLSGADLQDSVSDCRYFYCSFENANLSCSSIKGSLFVGCDFTGANMVGCRVDPAELETLGLSSAQIAQISGQSNTTGRKFRFSDLKSLFRRQKSD